MSEKLHYPRSSIVIEKQIRNLPHLEEPSSSLPDRRIDFLVYVTKGERLIPLLLVECKRGDLHLSALHQVRGYNYYVGALFIGIAGPEEFLLGYEVNGIRKTCPFLPSYPTLKSMISSDDARGG